MGFVPEAITNPTARALFQPQIQEDLEQGRFAAQAGYLNARLGLADQSFQLREKAEQDRQNDLQAKQQRAQQDAEKEADFKNRGVVYDPKTLQPQLDQNRNEVFHPIDASQAMKNGVKYADEKGNGQDNDGFTGLPPGKAYVVTRDSTGQIQAQDPDQVATGDNKMKAVPFTDSAGKPYVNTQSKFNDWQYLPAEDILSGNQQQFQGQAAEAVRQARLGTAQAGLDALTKDPDGSGSALDKSKAAINPDDYAGIIKDTVWNAPPQAQLNAILPTFKQAQQTVAAGRPKAQPPATALGIAIPFTGGGIDPVADKAYTDAQQTVNALGPHIQNLQQYVELAQQAKQYGDKKSIPGIVQEYASKKAMRPKGAP
jgi:hypothetical protein